MNFVDNSSTINANKNKSFSFFEKKQSESAKNAPDDIRKNSRQMLLTLDWEIISSIDGISERGLNLLIKFFHRHSETWHVTIEGIAKYMRWGKKTALNAVNELKSLGFLRIRKAQDRSVADEYTLYSLGGGKKVIVKVFNPLPEAEIGTDFDKRVAVRPDRTEIAHNLWKNGEPNRRRKLTGSVSKPLVSGMMAPKQPKDPAARFLDGTAIDKNNVAVSVKEDISISANAEFSQIGLADSFSELENETNAKIEALKKNAFSTKSRKYRECLNNICRAFEQKKAEIKKRAAVVPGFKSVFGICYRVRNSAEVDAEAKEITKQLSCKLIDMSILKSKFKNLSDAAQSIGLKRLQIWRESNGRKEFMNF